MNMLRLAMERLKLSARAYNRILKTSSPRTSPKPSATATSTAATGLRRGFARVV